MQFEIGLTGATGWLPNHIRSETSYYGHMSPLLAIILLARQSGTISFSTPGAPFDQVCARLAKQTGLMIEPTGDLKDEVIALNVREIPGKELIDRLAHVLYAKATFKNDQWQFVEDSAAATERQRTALKIRTENIKRAQAAVLAQVESEGAFDANKLSKRLSVFSKVYEQPNHDNDGKAYMAFEQIRRDGPGCRAVRRLISQLPADVLAEMPGGDVLVFSDQPRRYQVRLGDEARECIAEAAAEQNAWVSAYQSDGTIETRGWSYSGDPRFSTEHIDPSQIRLFLKATMNADSNLPQFEAEFATEDGIVLLSTLCDMQADAKPAKPDPASPPDNEAALSLSPLSKAQVVAYRKGPHTFVDGARGESRNWILNPEKFEPLGGAVSEALFEAARAKHKNLVACIPDEAFNLMYTFGGDNGEMWPYKPSGVLATIAKMSAQLEEDASCLEIRGNGTDPRTDRAALGRLIRQEDEDGCLRLLPLVQFAGLLKSNEWNSVAWQAVDPIVPGSLESAEIPEWLPLRLLGHLSIEQRAALVAGQTLRVDSLPEYVQNGIHHAVFYRSGQNLSFPYATRRNVGRHLTLDREPTEILPDGFSRDATVSLTSTTSLALAAISVENWVTPMSLSDFAIHSLAQQFSQFQNRDRLRGELTPTVHVGRQTHYQLQWHLAPGISLTHRLTDNDFKLSSPPTPAGALPDDYQKQLATEMAIVQKQGGTSIPKTVVTTPPPR